MKLVFTFIHHAIRLSMRNDEDASREIGIPCSPGFGRLVLNDTIYRVRKDLLEVLSE